MNDSTDISERQKRRGLFARARGALVKSWRVFVAWFDADAPMAGGNRDSVAQKWLRCLPFVAIHLGCLAVFWVGGSWPAVGVALFLYFFRVFALTGFYHRYFSHRSFRANRFWQFVFAVSGMMAAQRGPLWWASHHRHHHLHSDTEHDSHSPQDGFWRSHMGWFMDMRHFQTDYSRVGDFAKYPELVFLNRFDSLVPIAMVVGLFFLGEWWVPNGGGLQFVVWGGCISTVAVYHVTFFINSLCHVLGGQRFVTTDTSRNNWFLALLTFGEGWHNNHHRYPASARQGFYWWEVDVTYYLLLALSKIGVVSELRAVPQGVLEEGRALDAAAAENR